MSDKSKGSGDNGKVCCLLCVCCGCGSAEQSAALRDWFMNHAELGQDEATTAASELLANFDLAPHGSLKEFKGAIAKLARASQA